MSQSKGKAILFDSLLNKLEGSAIRFAPGDKYMGYTSDGQRITVEGPKVAGKEIMMSERLTREALDKLNYKWGNGGGILMAKVMDAIESDREAIREETRAELLKDHFKIGEVIEANTGLGWQRRTVVLVKDPTGNWDVASEAVRRPTKKRPMTREEKIKEVIARTGFLMQFDAIQESTLDALAGDLGILMETDK